MRNFERSYLYFLNQRGQLYHIFDVAGFLCRSTVPTGPAFLREEKFLDFFFQRLQPNPEFFTSNVGDQDLLQRTCWSNPQLPWSLSRHRSVPLPNSRNSRNDDTRVPAGSAACFPWMSVCGTEEVNYVVAEDAPVVFHDLQWCAEMKDVEICRESMALFEETLKHDASTSVTPVVDCDASHPPLRNATAGLHTTPISGRASASKPRTPALIFGGTLRQPFSPSQLRCSKDGLLYHPVALHLPRRAWSRCILGRQGTTKADGDAFPRDGFLLGLLAPQVCVKLGLGFVADASSDGMEVAYQIEWLGEVHKILFLQET